VVKNIPEINANLWKVKHLIKIEPITFPYGEPTENDINHTYLKVNGECIVVKEIGGEGGQKRLEAADEIFKDPKKLDGSTLRRDTRMKWLNHW
jgi:large subunit ribosomal protein L30